MSDTGDSISSIGISRNSGGNAVRAKGSDHPKEMKCERILSAISVLP